LAVLPYHPTPPISGSRVLTRAPSADATAFFIGCIPNRNSVTNAPEPNDIPFRASTGVWLTRRDIDVFVDAYEETAKKLGDR